MKRTPLVLTMALLLALLVLNARVGSAEPQTVPSASGYELSWNSIDGGGTMNLQSGALTLNGTFGQYDAGAQTAGDYRQSGGFWGFLDSLSNLFLPLMQR